MTSKLSHARQAYLNNDPPVEINQIWSGDDEEGNVFRRIRILAPHPDPDTSTGGRLWIYCDIPGGRMKTQLYEPRTCPELNLRFVFKLEKDAYSPV